MKNNARTEKKYYVVLPVVHAVSYIEETTGELLIRAKRKYIFQFLEDALCGFEPNVIHTSCTLGEYKQRAYLLPKKPYVPLHARHVLRARLARNLSHKCLSPAVMTCMGLPRVNFIHTYEIRNLFNIQRNAVCHHSTLNN